MPRTPNTNEPNICYDKSRQKFRIEMRLGSQGSRTARVDKLSQAVEIRDKWLAEREQVLAKDKAERLANETPGFSIVPGDYVLNFD